MRIRETANETAICLSKFKFNCDEIDPSIPEPLPKNLNHFLMIVGKPGSSKTTLLLNLIAKRGKNYNKKYDRVYLFSPSLCTIDDCPFEDLAHTSQGAPSPFGGGRCAAAVLIDLPRSCRFGHEKAAPRLGASRFPPLPMPGSGGDAERHKARSQLTVTGRELHPLPRQRPGPPSLQSDSQNH